jgi:hypothetical protein
MYLVAEEYISRNDYSRLSDEFVVNDTFAKIVSAIGAEDKIYQGSFSGGISLDIPMGYWRKANAIHNWFVRECGDNIDECQRIGVTEDKMRELLDLCILVKNNPSLANKLLPTGSGFFFGSTEYDEWYFGQIDETISILENALASGYSWFIYQASW